MNEDRLDVDAQEQAREDQQRLARHDAEQRKTDIQWIMSSAAGRRFMWRQLDFCGLWRSSYQTDNRDDVHFREGGRNVGLKLLGELRQYCPDLEIKMLEENRK